MNPDAKLLWPGPRWTLAFLLAALPVGFVSENETASASMSA